MSVIVTSYTLDRVKDVQGVLESLHAQTYRNLEIIFVGEGTQEICHRIEGFAMQKGIANLRTVFNDGVPGLSPARNLGAKHSRGDIIAFIDDDAIAFPDWVQEIVDAFRQNAGAIGLTGPAYPLWQGNKLEWFPEEFYWLLSCPTPGWTGFTRPTIVRNAWGMNMAFRKEAFDSCRFSEAFVGGEKTGADDVEFSMQVRRATGKVILFHPAVRVSHKVYRNRLSASFIRRKSFRDGYGKAILKKLYPEGKEASFNIHIEIAVLRLILLRFFPRMLGRLPRDPIGAWNQFRVASIALFYTGAGYLAGYLKGTGSLLRDSRKAKANERRV
ncbi:MAG: glycosyltransferase family 2 protein [Chloroflexota bacterium]|nr:glycosyltransferase family 2 protein [Chloroflexota bacterium]